MPAGSSRRVASRPSDPVSHAAFRESVFNNRAVRCYTLPFCLCRNAACLSENYGVFW